jgi:hypothetical protein
VQQISDAILMSYARLLKKPLLFRSFTGLTISEFDAIYVDIESRYNEYDAVPFSSSLTKYFEISILSDSIDSFYLFS